MFIDANCSRIEPTEELRNKIWTVELELFETFKKICQKYQLKYFLIGGALIGAIRHGGFIPWDDDIDIGMPREDFKKFLKIVNAELPNSMEVQYGFTKEGRFEELMRIRNKNTTGILTRNLKDGMNNGIFIEIYCYTSVPSSMWGQKAQMYFMNFFGTILDSYVKQETSRKTTRKQKLVHGLSKVICKVLPKSAAYHLWNLSHDIFASKDSELMNCEISMFGIETGRSVWNRVDIEPLIEVPFENTTALIPHNYDSCLKKCYGDYMSLPPVEQRNNLHLCDILYNPDLPYMFYSSSMERLNKLEELVNETKG